MTPYPKYKPSGIEWIGDVPEEWEVKKLKYLLKPVKGALKPGPFGSDLKTSDLSEHGSIKVYTQRNVIDNDFDSGNDFIDEPKFEKLIAFEIEPDDILVSTRGTIGRSAIFPNGKQKGILHPCLIRVQINPDIAINEWVQTYFNESVQFKENVKLNSNSTIIDVIYGNTLMEVFIPLPTLDSQNRILIFLDKKTSQIDLLISNKQKLIGLLKEEKTAIINEAVTKGINKKAKLKPSGIEWLGDVPEHWEVKKLKYLVFKIGSGVTPSGGSSVYQTSGIPLLRSQNIHFDGLRLDDVAYITPEIDDSMKNSRVEPGDVLLNITGASIGRCFYLDEDFGKGNVNQHVCILRPDRKRVLTRYLYLILYSSVGQTQIDLLQTGANREGLNFEQLKNFSLPLPELNEQVLILNYFEKQRSKIDHAISRIEKEIELMQEYRTALISEVVTGKVRVG